jgi:hypothetical protein
MAKKEKEIRAAESGSESIEGKKLRFFDLLKELFAVEIGKEKVESFILEINWENNEVLLTEASADDCVEEEKSVKSDCESNAVEELKGKIDDLLRKISEQDEVISNLEKEKEENAEKKKRGIFGINVRGLKHPPVGANVKTYQSNIHGSGGM